MLLITLLNQIHRVDLALLQALVRVETKVVFGLVYSSTPDQHLVFVDEGRLVDGSCTHLIIYLIIEHSSVR